MSSVMLKTNGFQLLVAISEASQKDKRRYRGWKTCKEEKGASGEQTQREKHGTRGL